jgi:hypothetical protein
MEVTIVVATFGAERWRELAAARAIPSALAQGVPVVAIHGGDSIADARNAALRLVETEWMIYLDSDDELEAGYVEALRRVSGDLLAPSVRMVVDGIPGEVESLAARNMDTMNPCVIGTAVRRSAIEAVGGWLDEPAWEDWSLFRRIWWTGGSIVHVPDAVYRVHVDPLGRNSTVPDPVTLHRQIRRDHRRRLGPRVAR